LDALIVTYALLLSFDLWSPHSGPKLVFSLLHENAEESEPIACRAQKYLRRTHSEIPPKEAPSRRAGTNTWIRFALRKQSWHRPGLTWSLSILCPLRIVYVWPIRFRAWLDDWDSRSAKA
jgi:hypothetical protein